ncbi:MAG: gamma-glutamyltranspeptidase / glutathione hydrolase [Hyphomicrobiales bacterium]|jgi:gamma-glutamyltranspeptidase/glutathione hydrolase|nr:gamma-glutamyltranspeptidase / glutathione hydrolase [Hyphomicrobiales bacterium]
MIQPDLRQGGPQLSSGGMNFTPAPHVTQHWQVTKPAASGKRGMVVSQSRNAAEAGVAALDAGGNAIDAALSTALALAALEPWNSGLGGIGHAVVHRAGQARAETVDFGPTAPAALNPKLFKLTGKVAADLFGWPEVEGDVNIHGPLSFAIPSALAGYEEMHRRWGRLPLAEIAAPAVALARRGLPQDWFTALKVANSAAILRRYPESARIYLRDGLPPVPPYQGGLNYFRLGNLPDTLERLQRAGWRDLYEGEIAANIIADVKALGGVLSAEDLRNCKARVSPATEVPWRGRTLQLAGPLTAAPTAADVLRQMADVRFGAAPDAAWYVALARALKAAYAQRLTSLGDAEPVAAESCTTHITTCDADGTMVAMTTTLLSSMGSRVVLPTTGILMNNGVMWFDPRPGQPNSIGPGKRPLTNMFPVILREGAAPSIAAGASGGRRIMAAVLQLVSFVADFGMSPEAAAHQPRIDVSGPDKVTADRRLAPDILRALEADGPLEIVEHAVLPINFACPNLLMQRDGVRTGISDAASPWSAAVAQG